MQRLLIAAPLLAAIMTNATACNSATQGQAQPVASRPSSPDTGDPSDQPSSTTSSSSRASRGSGRLGDIDACKLITQQEGQKHQINRVERIDLGGARACQYLTANSEFGLTLGIRENQGIADFNEDYGKTTDTTVGNYPAKEQVSAGGACLVAIGFTESSSVDVIVSASGKQEKTCELSREFAALVASKVTPG